jgi:hypothetical protein
MNLKRFDAYEVSPVVETTPESGEAYCEAFLSIEDAQDALKQYASGASERIIWSLYGHRAGEGVECIADFPDEAGAFQMLFAITGITGESGRTVYQLPEADDTTLRMSSTIEVFYDLVADYHAGVGAGTYDMEKIDEDSRTRRDVFILWTNEFQKLHANTDWDTTDYFETQESFLAKKLAELA